MSAVDCSGGGELGGGGTEGGWELGSGGGGGGLSKGVNGGGTEFVRGGGGGIVSECGAELPGPGSCPSEVTGEGLKGKGPDGLTRKLLPGIMRGETWLKGGFGVVFSQGLPGP